MFEISRLFFLVDQSCSNMDTVGEKRKIFSPLFGASTWIEKTAHAQPKIIPIIQNGGYVKFPHPRTRQYCQIPETRSIIDDQFPGGCTPPPPTLGLNIDRRIKCSSHCLYFVLWSILFRIHIRPCTVIYQNVLHQYLSNHLFYTKKQPKKTQKTKNDCIQWINIYNPYVDCDMCPASPIAGLLGLN
jgi:hypothetical protein